METALTKAHDHARAADRATKAGDTTTALAEHALAASEFAQAATTITSPFAIRQLKLLEDHHRQLHDVLKLRHDLPSQQSTADSDIPEEDEEEVPGEQDDQPKTKTPAKGAGSATSTAPVKPVPTLPQQRKYPGRELSSSIASNLASARGIKSKYSGQPLAPSVSNDQAPGSLEARPRREGSLKGSTVGAGRQPSWVPPSQQAIKEDVSTTAAPPAANPDERFTRFMSNFGGLLGRFSAPLLFAGLPLVPEESTASETTASPSPESPSQRKPRQQKPPPAPANPDLSKIFSRATLRAVYRDHGGESFYVVPPSGHTASYASILNHDNKEKRRLAASRDESDFGDDNDDDDFVDARESQGPILSGLRRNPAGRTKSERELLNKIEELSTQNATLKEMMDKVTKRLHAFELNSQSAHLALAQSVRLQRPGSPMSSSSVGTTDEALKRRNRELEEKINALETENAKLSHTIGRYREKWEQLKAGAKTRLAAKTAGEAELPGTPNR